MANVYWITGLSGAGKTSLGRRLVHYLREKDHPAVMIDGDELRGIIGEIDTHSRSDRLKLAFFYSKLSMLIALQGIDVAVATISMFHQVHEWNRNNLPGYVEIFLDVPLEELFRRDPKGIYKRSMNGELKNIAGIDCKIETPKKPDIHIPWHSSIKEDDVFKKVVKHLSSCGIIRK